MGRPVRCRAGCFAFRLALRTPRAGPGTLTCSSTRKMYQPMMSSSAEAAATAAMLPGGGGGSVGRWVGGGVGGGTALPGLAEGRESGVLGRAHCRRRRGCALSSRPCPSAQARLGRVRGGWPRAPGFAQEKRKGENCDFAPCSFHTDPPPTSPLGTPPLPEASAASARRVGVRWRGAATRRSAKVSRGGVHASGQNPRRSACRASVRVHRRP